MSDGLDRADYFERWAALHGGYDPRTGSALVRGWLAVVLVVARPLARARVAPDLLTGAGVVVAGGGVVLAGWSPLAAALALLASALLDGVDGSVAVLSDRTTRWGYVLDSVADRVSDGLFLVALWLAGGDPRLCVLAGAGTGLLEYARARAAGAGMSEVGVVTVGERPIRVVLVIVALLCTPIYGPSASLGALAIAGLTTVGLGQITVVIRSSLR